MDKRDKKRSEVLKTRLVKLRQLLAAAKSQPDDADELRNLEKEVADVTAELAKLKE